MFVDKIFERATIRGLWDYRLFGLGADEDDRSYEERLDEPYMRFEKAVEKYDRSNTSELRDLCNEVSNETASVYMEIGLQAGILFIVKKVEVGSFNDSFLSEESSQDAKLEKMQEIPSKARMTRLCWRGLTLLWFRRLPTRIWRAAIS